MITRWFPIARFFVTATLLIGAYLHLNNLFFGTDLLLRYVYTPLFDSLFAIPMIIGAGATMAAWREYDFRNLFEKIIVVWTAFYFTASIPLHAQVWFTQNTEYIRAFPVWFSAIFLTYTSVMQYVWLNLKSKSPQSAAQPAAEAS